MTFKNKNGSKLVSLGTLILTLICMPCLGILSCDSAANSQSSQISFNLNDSLKKYASVVITILDPSDESIILDIAFEGKLLHPSTLAPYKIPPKVGSDFRVRIQGFNDSGLLALETNIRVISGTAGKPQKTLPESLPGWVPIVDTTTVPVEPVITPVDSSQ